MSIFLNTQGHFETLAFLMNTSDMDLIKDCYIKKENTWVSNQNTFYQSVSVSYQSTGMSSQSDI